MRPRWRRWLSGLCLALAGILLPLGVLATWADAVFFDSRTFSERTVQLLDSPAMRRELAERITEQLALAGNRQAINFGPAFQLAIEGAVNTDAFRSIFRTAVQRAHEQVLGEGGDGALDLSDSVAIIANTIQLVQGSEPGAADERSLDATLTDVTQRMSDLNVWRWERRIDLVEWGGLIGAALLAGVGIALAADHRRAVRRMGWIVVAGGLVVSALVVVAVWFAGRLVSDSQLAQGIQDGVEGWTRDLRTLGFWVAGYGVVMAAAAAAGARRITPEHTAERVAAWIEKQRASTGSTLGLAVLFVGAGALLVASPSFWLRAAILGLGLWLIYFGVTEVLTLVRSKAPVPATEADGRSGLVARVLVPGIAILAVLAVLSVGLFATTSNAAREASARGAPVCNGEQAFCDLPINRVVFPGTHNSMSAALNPGWLFAEHVRPIASQLEGGIRALLIDTHYGLPSSSRLPGSDTPVILTDLAADLSQPSGEQADPARAARAAELAAKSSPRADAVRDIFLCHNYCELGAVRFADVLGDIKSFLDTNPDEIVMTVIQDATSPADTADAIVRAGLEDRVFTLQPDRPLPTLRDMIESGRTLLVFAEVGGPGAPPWYHSAYERWFQETPYQWESAAEMNCAPNRGTAEAPFFLVNHWLHASPPDPARANSVNRRQPLTDRLRRCVSERNLVPNVVAVDFAEQGDLIETVADINDQLREQVGDVQGRPRPTTTAPGAATPTTSPPAGATTTTAPAASASPLPLPTPTVITSLTGGDPARFCDRRPITRSIVSAWALAQVVAPPGGRGLTDLAFGPAAARAFDVIGPALPAELVATTAPTRDRAQAAAKALTDLGLDAKAIGELADLVEARLASDDYPDPVAVQTAVLDRERTLVGGPRLEAAASAFTAAQPDVPGLFDLGDVPDDLARSRGFTCLVPEGG